MTDGYFGEGHDCRPRLEGQALQDAVNEAMTNVLAGDEHDRHVFLSQSPISMADDMVRYDADLDNQEPRDLISYIEQYLRERGLLKIEWVRPQEGLLKIDWYRS